MTIPIAVIIQETTQTKILNLGNLQTGRPRGPPEMLVLGLTFPLLVLVKIHQLPIRLLLKLLKVTFFDKARSYNSLFSFFVGVLLDIV